MRPASAATRCSRRPQRVAFSGRQRCRDLVFQRGCLLIERREQAAGLRGQGDRDCATVVGMGQPFGQSLLLQVIDRGDHRVAMNAESVRELALRLSVVSGECG